MSTQTIPTAALGQKHEATPAAPKAKKERSTFTVSLHGEDGSSLRIGLKLRKDGTATTHAAHTVGPKGKRTHTSGATAHHANGNGGKAEGLLDGLAHQGVFPVVTMVGGWLCRL